MIDTLSVENFLQSRFNLRILNVRQIGSGMFSQTFAFDLDHKELIIRFNRYEEDFRKDLFAYQHFSSKLPIPKMLDWGRFNHHYYFAISERCVGHTLNLLESSSVRNIAPGLFDTLYRLQSFDTSQYSGWGLTNAMGYGRFASWSQYLLTFYNQKFSFTWEHLFQHTCMEREVYKLYLPVMQKYLPFCLTDKYWVHGDFGFDNTVTYGNRITGVLDWAESRLGDFVYDIAYLEFWSKDVSYKTLWQEWAETRNLPVQNFEQRMSCYLLHIGLQSLALAAIRDDVAEYTLVKQRVQSVLATTQ